MQYKIDILGCGLGGMITALALANNNIHTTIIEGRSAAHKDFFNDIRTTALTSSSKKFFKKIGVWDDVSKIAGPINDIYVADNKAPEMLHFASEELEHGEIMGHLVQNTEFKKCLFDLISANKHITLIEESPYEIIENRPDGCKLLLNKKSERNCDLLLVCDGQRSKAKQLYFTSETEKNYDQCAITFIAHHQKKHEGTAVEHFMPTGPFAILPLRDQNLSSIVWTVESDMKDAIMNLPKDEFTYLVQKNFGDFLGEIEIKTEAAAFPLKAYATSQYYNNSVVLVADTAHIMHPLAGQGLNQGIKDIDTLASLLFELGPSEYMLKTYQEGRKTDNSNMLEITDTINSVFSNHSKVMHGARRVGFNAIEKIPPFKKLMIKYAMGKR